MHMLKKFLFLISVLLGPISVTHSLELQRTVIDDTLPNVGIYSITQDKKGFLWLASTNTGVLRFDGYQFEPFVSEQNQLARSPDIDALLFDAQGYLWTGSWGYGLARFDLTSGAETHFKAGPAENELYSPFVQVLFEDRKKRVWIGTDKGLNRYDEKQGLAKIFGGSELENPRIWAIAESSDQSIWVGTSFGVYRINPDGSLGKPLFPHGPDSRTNEIRAMVIVDEILWIGTREALFALNLTTSELNRIPYFEQENFPIINSLLFDGHDQLLVGTFDGISLVNTKNYQTKYVAGKKSLLENVNVRTLFLDSSGLLWAGTREKGLYRTRLQFEQINNWQNPAFMRWQLQQQQAVLALAIKDNTLFIGDYDEVRWGDPNVGYLENIQLIGSRVNALQLDNQSKLWLGADNGIWRFDENNQNFKPSNEILQQNGITSQNVRDLAILPDNRIVIGLWSDGILIWDPIKKQSERILADIAKTLTGDAIQDIEIVDNTIWIVARLSGLYRYDVVRKELTAFSKLNSALGQGAVCVAKGPRETLLICTSHGLMIYHPITGSVQHYGIEDGLADNHLLSAVTDNKMRIWVGSPKGLSVYLPDQNNFVTFTQQDGLISSEMMYKALLISKNKIYAGSSQGLNSINTDQIRFNTKIPNIEITDFLVNQQPMKPKNSANFELSAWQNNVEFRFSALDFSNVNLNRFEVKLVGYDKDWVQLIGHNSAVYQNLPANNYQFMVRGSNNHGFFNTEFKQINFEVKPYWWQRTDLRILAFLLLMASVSILYRRRVSRIEQLNKLLQANNQAQEQNNQALEFKVAARTAELKSLLDDLARSNSELRKLDQLKDEFIGTVSHELRTPLTSIHGAIKLLGIPHLEENMRSKLLATAEENSNRLVILINDLLDLQKYENGSLEISTTSQPLLPLVEQAVSSLQTYAQKFGVTLSILHDQSLLCELHFDSNRIRQVLDNLLSNAIKFSKSGGEVKIYSVFHPGFLEINVEDCGDGIPLEIQPQIFGKFVQANSASNKTVYGSGLGLAICRRIVELHQGQIGFMSKPGQGTRFWFRLPLETDIVE